MRLGSSPDSKQVSEVTVVIPFGNHAFGRSEVGVPFSYLAYTRLQIFELSP